MILRLFKFILASTLVLSLGIWFLLHSRFVQDPLKIWVNEIIANETGFNVSIDRFSFGIPALIKAHDISFEDSRTGAIKVSEILLTFSLTKIFNKDYIPLEVEIKGADVEKISPLGPIDISLVMDSWETAKEANIHIKRSTQEIYDIPAELKSKIQLNSNGTVTLNDIELNAHSLSASGSLLLFPSDLSAQGDLKIECDDLSLCSQLTDSNVHGFLKGDISFSRNKEIPIQFSLIGGDIALDTFRSDFIRVAGIIKNPKIAPSIDFIFKIENGFYESTRLTNLDLAVSFDPSSERNPFKLSFKGENKELTPFNLNAEGNINARMLLPKIEIDIDTLNGEIAKTPVTFIKPCQMTYFENQYSLNAPSINVAGGLFNTHFNITKGLINGEILLEDFPLDHLGAPLSLAGKLSSKATIEGTLAKPKVHITLDSTEIAFLDEALDKVPSANAHLEAVTEGDNFAINGSLNIPNHLPIDFNATIPLKLSLEPIKIDIDSKEKISGSFTGSTELSALLQFFPDSPSLSGEIDTKIELSGTIDAPIFLGTCTLTNGTFALQKIGTSLHDLSAHFFIENGNATLTHLEAFDQEKGKVTGNGHINLSLSQNGPFELNLFISNAIVLDLDAIKASFDGEITLAGDFSGAKLTGKGSSTSGLYTIPLQPSAVINNVDVTYINKPEHEEAPQAESFVTSSALWPLAFDLSLDIPKNFKIEGKDLSSLWKGTLALKGSTLNPQFYGELKLVDGKYSFNGKPLILEEGTITFAGDLEKKLSLYVIANRDLNDVNIDIILKGPVKNPSISFRSNPPMPQREILSWLLFNTGTSEISPFQGSQLSESITNLNTASQNTGTDVLTKIRTTLGIDRLEIGRCGNGSDSQMSLQVGKYISDNVMICINKREVNSVAIEASLYDKFKLQAQVSDDAQGQMLLKWKKDY